MRRIALLTVFFAACSGETQQAADEPDNEPRTEESQVTSQPITDPREVTFAPALQVDLDAMELQESGLYIQVIEEGAGSPAVSGDTMGVHYTVWLSDGSKLDSSLDGAPPTPLEMILDGTPLIDGWTEGVTGMRLGEKRRLVVPYDLGYGAAGRPPQLPPYSTLVFELELARHAPGGGD